MRAMSMRQPNNSDLSARSWTKQHRQARCTRKPHPERNHVLQSNSTSSKQKRHRQNERVLSTDVMTSVTRWRNPVSSRPRLSSTHRDLDRLGRDEKRSPLHAFLPICPGFDASPLWRVCSLNYRVNSAQGCGSDIKYSRKSSENIVPLLPDCRFSIAAALFKPRKPRITAWRCLS